MNKLTNKDLVQLQKFASASIIEETNGTFIMSPKDTSAIYLSILSLNRNLISKHPDFELLNQDGDCYTFNTSMFNSFIDKYKSFGFIFSENSKQGHSGNVSISYLTDTRDYKIINESMYNIISKSELKIVLVKDSEKFLLDINNISDWDNFIKNIKEYKPLRLFIKNVSAPECCVFYLKPINAYLRKIYDDLMYDFSSKKGLIKMKSKEIRETFNFEISDYYKGSNNNYYVEADGLKLLKIYLVEKTHLYFPYDVSDIHFYDDYSFYKSTYNLHKENSIFERIDPLQLYSDNLNNKKIDPLVFFNRKHMIDIHSIIQNNIKTSKDVILNESDSNFLKKLSSFKSNIFDIVKNDEDKYIIRIKKRKDSNITVNLYDRKHKKYDNTDNQITWFFAINQGLSFEREKTLSVFFIQKFIYDLVKKGHRDIEIELEKPIQKKDGRQGFLDFVVTSKFKEYKYGQVFEFKAVYNWNEENHTEQVNSYDITSNIIDKYNLNSSYEKLNYNEVKLLNLI
jgi:hypothetical protein